MNFSAGWRIAAGFILWCSIIALRSIYTHPYQPLWFVGNVMSGAAAFTVGVMWSKRTPIREKLRRVHRG